MLWYLLHTTGSAHSDNALLWLAIAFAVIFGLYVWRSGRRGASDHEEKPTSRRSARRPPDERPDSQP